MLAQRRGKVAAEGVKILAAATVGGSACAATFYGQIYSTDAAVDKSKQLGLATFLALDILLFLNAIVKPWVYSFLDQGRLKELAGDSHAAKYAKRFLKGFMAETLAVVVATACVTGAMEFTREYYPPRFTGAEVLADTEVLSRFLPTVLGTKSGVAVLLRTLLGDLFTVYQHLCNALGIAAEVGAIEGYARAAVPVMTPAANAFSVAVVLGPLVYILLTSMTASYSRPASSQNTSEGEALLAQSSSASGGATALVVGVAGSLNDGGVGAAAAI